VGDVVVGTADEGCNVGVVDDAGEPVAGAPVVEEEGATVVAAVGATVAPSVVGAPVALVPVGETVICWETEGGFVCGEGASVPVASHKGFENWHVTPAFEHSGTEKHASFGASCVLPDKSTNVAPAVIRLPTCLLGNVAATRLLFTRLTRVMVLPSQTTRIGSSIGCVFLHSQALV
jgi:hypothetical protein